MVERNMSGAAMRGTVACRGRRTHHVQKVCVGNWEIAASVHWQEYALVRIGKVRNRSR